MPNLFISFGDKESCTGTFGSYGQCSFKNFEQCISQDEVTERNKLLMLPICLLSKCLLKDDLSALSTSETKI